MSQTLQERAHHTNSGDVAYWVDASASTDMPWLVSLPGLIADHILLDTRMTHPSGKAKCLVRDTPAHGKPRSYPPDFSLDDYARILHGVLEVENVKDPVLVGQSLGGYVAQVLIDLYPGEAFGLVSIDSAPLKRKYYPTWEVKALRHTKSMYRSIPWSWLRSSGSWGIVTTAEGKTSMCSFMESYTKKEYVEFAAHDYTMSTDAVEPRRAYDIDRPVLLFCGEKNRASDVKASNRKWSAGESIPLVWVPDAGHNSNADNPSFVNSQIEQLMTTL